MICKNRSVPSPIVKRSIKIARHATSVSLEKEFWEALQQIASGQGITVSELVHRIDSAREVGGLSSGIRLFVLRSLQRSAAVTPMTLGDMRQHTPKNVSFDLTRVRVEGASGRLRPNRLRALKI
jgi:predicted DNA-binding ribbon-helix-helix protein